MSDRLEVLSSVIVVSGLREADVYRVAGISKQLLESWEAGGEPTPATIARVAVACAVMRSRDPATTGSMLIRQVAAAMVRV